MFLLYPSRRYIYYLWFTTELERHTFFFLVFG